MSTFPLYKTKTFSPTQKFFVLDPNTGSPAFVQGSDLIDQITPSSNYVYAEATRTTAQATDYPVGALIETAGATSAGDNFAAVYLVVESGAGDFPMNNGNELLVIKGDELLRQQLATEAAGEGSDLVVKADTGETVTAALNQRTIYVGSVAELGALSVNDGVAVSVESFWSGQDTGGGLLYWDASRSKADHNGVSIIDPDKTSELGAIGVYGAYFTAAMSGTGCYVRKDVSLAAMVEWAGANETIADNSKAIQAVADNFTIVCGLPGKTYSHSSTINLTLFGAALVSNNSGHGYTGVTYQYDGSGTQFSCDGAVNYGTLYRVHLKGVPAVSTDYYNTGSEAVNTQLGATSIEVIESWVEGFEVLFQSSTNSFYNKFIGNRLERTATALSNFSNNNLIVEKNRFQRFNKAIIHNGPNGPLNIFNNSFEIFNGQIAEATGAEKGIVNFYGNYVEIYDNEDLPTNFPASGPGAQVGKFGGNTFFTGPYASLNLIDNELQLNGAFRVTTLSLCNHFRAVGNNYHQYAGGNNLDRLYGLPTCESVEINDTLGSVGGAGPYSRTYNQVPININKAENFHYHYDAITSSVIQTPTKLEAQTLTNGWTAPDANFGAPKAEYKDGHIVLSGLIDGSSRTAAPAFTLSTNFRPYEFGSTKVYTNLTAFSAFGGGTIVRFRYFYATGAFQVEGTPASAADIALDGLVIPART